MGMIETLRSVVRVRRFETDSVQRRLNRAANVADLRRIAKRRLPGGVFDYIDGAAEDERTLDRNSAGFGRIEFRPRVLTDVSACDPSTTLLGEPLSSPIVLAPTGFTRIADPQGELAVARSAERAGLPYALSTMGTRSIEEVAEVSQGRKWFQVYVWKDTELVAEMLDRAKRHDYEAIVITVDTAVLGRRERDVRRGFTLPPKIGLETFVDGALHPQWTLDFLRSEPISFANVKGRSVGDGSTAVSLAQYANDQFDQSLSWDRIGWFRDRWSGPIVLKGIQTVEDARRAVDAGAEAIALSNHGGRQLDDAPVPIELVGPVTDAIGDAAEVICDGGVRRGSDVVKAVALGAKACMIGRAYLYGLGAGGERGVDHVLDMFDAGIRRTMALTGARTVDEISPELVAWRD
ncbi:MAG: alpha-hydroxy acid oxidase [Actinomycetota bacterium]